MRPSESPSFPFLFPPLFCFPCCDYSIALFTVYVN
nr:MAG TPA: hypothetical protein [Caudoviricetes sp.]